MATSVAPTISPLRCRATCSTPPTWAAPCAASSPTVPARRTTPAHDHQPRLKGCFCMRRSLFDADHDALRDSVREFVTRHLEPTEEKFIEQRYIDRWIWLQAGVNGYLGSEVSEQYGGSAADDYRFNAVLGEELVRSSAAAASSFGIQFGVAAPVRSP